MSKPNRRSEESYSGFPAAAVFFAMIFVTVTLVFRGHLFEGSPRARVYVPSSPSGLALTQQPACPPSVCPAQLPR